MQVSSKGKYAVRAVFDIALNSKDGEPVPLAAISQRQGISVLFLEQLFQKLRKGGIVRSVRGSHGGYVLARDPEHITVGEVVRLIERPLYTNSCFSKNESVDDCRIADTCLGYVLWKQLADHINNFLDSITLGDLCKRSRAEVAQDLRAKSHQILIERIAINRAAPKEERKEEMVGVI